MSGWDGTRTITAAQSEELKDHPWIQPTSQMQVFWKALRGRSINSSSVPVLSSHAMLCLKHPLHDAQPAAQCWVRISLSHALALGTSQAPFCHHVRLPLACKTLGDARTNLSGKTLFVEKGNKKANCKLLPEHSREIPRSASVHGLTCRKCWLCALPPGLCSPLRANTPGYNMGRSCLFPLC